ncbi:alpha-amylase family glycosyl hydrolase [Brevibacterium litoralis]|uniref:alpha-amylase family glycosyl hydrolase n=1 Tax=Brevibacterium litoralis TaxID=3138935 RepID=UPI0032EE62ED
MTFAVWAPRPDRVRVAWRPVDQDSAEGPYGADFARRSYLEEPVQESQLESWGFRIAEAHRNEAGWWHVPQPDGMETGTRFEYGYLLDDDPALLPDPRSDRQPYGPHGPSVLTVETSTYALDSIDFTDPGTGPTDLRSPAADGPGGWFRCARDWRGRPWDSSPVYEMHIGTFTPEGTFDAAAARLEHVASLGVGWVELLPVNTFAGLDNWGYDGVLWYAVQESYGGPEAYRRFVDRAHELGMGVVQDVVFNHLGPSGNHLPRFAPYLHQAASNPWGDSINLDGPESDEVREYVLDCLEMFALDLGVDAFRLDAVHALVDSRAVHLLEEMTMRMEVVAAVRGYPAWLVAESDANDPRLVSLRVDGGYGLTAQWSDDFHHALHVALTGETSGYYTDFAAPGALAKTIGRGFFHDGTFSSFRGRSHGRPIPFDRVRPDQLVVCVQNHDQVGNRASGERLAHLLLEHDAPAHPHEDHSPAVATVDRALPDRPLGAPEPSSGRSRAAEERPAGTPPVPVPDHVHDGDHPGVRRLALAATLVLLSPNTPMLFMGEEFAATTPWQFFTDHREDWLGNAVRSGRRSEFSRHGWDPDRVPDPQETATTDRSVLDWTQAGEVPSTEVSAPGPDSHTVHTALLALHRQLGTLRTVRPEFTRLEFEDLAVGWAEDGSWVAYSLKDSLAVLVNLSTERRKVPVRSPESATGAGSGHGTAVGNGHGPGGDRTGTDGRGLVEDRAPRLLFEPVAHVADLLAGRPATPVDLSRKGAGRPAADRDDRTVDLSRVVLLPDGVAVLPPLSAAVVAFGA